MSPDPEKVDTIKKWPEPRDKGEVISADHTFCAQFMRPSNSKT